MTKLLFVPGIDTGNEIAIGIYTEKTLDDLYETVTRLFDLGKAGDKILIVKAEAGVSEEELLASSITTPDQKIVPDMWEMMDSYLNWLKAEGE